MWCVGQAEMRKQILVSRKEVLHNRTSAGGVEDGAEVMGEAPGQAKPWDLETGEDCSPFPTASPLRTNS